MLSYALAFRFDLPFLPFLDLDSYEYYETTLIYFETAKLEFTGLRGVLYPLFVLLCAGSGGLELVTIVQHLICVASALLVWLAFRAFVFQFAKATSLRLFSRFLFLLALAAYLYYPEIVYFEHSLRPEALFIAATNLVIAQAFSSRAFYLASNEALSKSFALLFSSILLAVACLLKPFFFLAGVATTICLIAFKLSEGSNWIQVAKALTLSIAIVICSKFTEVYFRAQDADPYSQATAQHVLFFHADLIKPILQEDLGGNHPQNYKRLLEGLLINIDYELLKTPAPARNQEFYHLGFDPHRIMFGYNSARLIREYFKEDGLRAAGFYYYFLRAIARNPLSYLAKVARHLSVVLFTLPAFVRHEIGFDLTYLYDQSIRALELRLAWRLERSGLVADYEKQVSAAGGESLFSGAIPRVLRRIQFLSRSLFLPILSSLIVLYMALYGVSQ